MGYFDTAWYVNFGNGSSTGYYAVTAWAATTSISAGALRRQLAAPTVNNERAFVAVVGGTTGGSEPAWTVTRGAKTTDNTVTWQECTGQAGVNGDLTNCPNWTTVKGQSVSLGQVIQRNNGVSLQICTTAGAAGSGSEPSFSDTAGTTTSDNTVTWTSLGAVGNFGAWAAPHARIRNAFAANWGLAGNTFYVGDNHAETSSAAISMASPATQTAPCLILSVDHTVSVPPSGSSALKTGASVTTSLNNNAFALNVEGAVNGASVYYYGINFDVSAGSSVVNIGSSGGGGSTNLNMVLDNCTFTLGTGGGHVSLGDSSVESRYTLNNPTFSFGNNIGQYISLGGGAINWRGGGTITIAAASLNNLFQISASAFGAVTTVVEGVDLSSSKITQLLATGQAGGNVLLKDCKIGSSVVVASQSGQATAATCTMDLVNCDSGATNYRSERHDMRGDLTTSTAIYRASGFAIEGTSLSWKLVTSASANINWWSPFLVPPVLIRNGVTATNRNITMYGVVNAAAVPNNDGFWFDVEYMGASGSPLGSVGAGGKANFLASGSALTADTSAWDGGATARQNSHAYSVGDIVKTSSNAGRIFFCITAGTSAGSEPAGYASAVDGGSVTDGTATFRAGCRFSLEVTLSSPQPGQAGIFTIYPKMAAAATTLFLDPLPVLS